MSLMTPDIRASTVASINPVAKLAVALILSAVLLLSIDAVSASVALLLEGVLLFWSGISARQFWIRTIPLWLAAPFAGITTVLYGADSGATLWQFGFVSITEGSASLGAAIVLRILCIGLPGIVLFATTDPTDLADGLSQVVRLPARFVLSQAFALLVISIRRGSKLATAMEAKGFGSDRPRTWARESVFGKREWALIGIGTAIAVIAVIAAVSTGNWHFVLDT